MASTEGQQSFTLPESVKSEHYTTSDIPHPHFYIVRPDSTFVPLIAVDEIHPTFRLKDVPFTLTLDMISDWNMARCGDEASRIQDYYQIELTGIMDEMGAKRSEKHRNSSSTSEAGMNEDSSSSKKGAVEVNEASKENQVNGGAEQCEVNGGQTWRRASESKDGPQAAIDHLLSEKKWNANNHHSRTKDAATPGIYGKKKFCTYWIRTGSCNYQQEGCKYMHVIPDEETRKKIGIRDIPKWIKEDMPQRMFEGNSGQEQRAVAANQPWRRQVPHYSHAELPVSSRTSRVLQRSSPATVPSGGYGPRLSPAATAAAAGGPRAFVAEHKNPYLTQYPNSHEGVSASQYVPTHSNHMAQQHPVNPALMNPYTAKGQSESVPTVEAESCMQRAQHSSPAPSHAHSTAHTASSRRFPAPNQAPIGRFTTAAHHSPDVLPPNVDLQANNSPAKQTVQNLSPTQAQEQPGSYPALHQSLRQLNFQDDGAHLLDSHPVLAPTPVSAHHANTPVSVQANTPSHNGLISPLGYTAAHTSGYAVSKGRGDHRGNADATNQPASPAYQPVAGIEPGPLHRRLFVRPGQSQYVANPNDEPKERRQPASKTKWSGHSIKGGPSKKAKQQYGELIGM